jgi:hypothetical protein
LVTVIDCMQDIPTDVPALPTDRFGGLDAGQGAGREGLKGCRCDNGAHVLQPLSLSPTRNLAGLALAAAGIALAAIAGYRAWIHWRLMFPFGAQGVCGQSVPHCGWCLAAAFGLILAASSAWLIRQPQPPRIANQAVRSTTTPG